MTARETDGIVFIDADDTLWENNLHFESVIGRYSAWVAAHGVDAPAARHALEAEEDVTIRTIGYGALPFSRSLRAALASLLPAAGPGLAAEIDAFVDEAIREIRDHEILLLPGVADALPRLGARHRLVVLTKGQPDEQRAKVVRSGLAPHFADVRVVPEKDVDTYRKAAALHGADPGACWMIGNSPHSDVNPARAAGFRTIYIPHPAPWHRDRGTLIGRGHPTLTARSFAEVPALIG